MNEEKKENLFKRLIARFHNPKIAQKLTSLVVTGVLLLSLSACDDTTTPDNNNNDPNNNTSNVGGGNNTNNNNNSNQNNNNNNIDISGYSELLQNVLLNEEYDNLIAQVKNGDGELLKKGYFQPHPYGFLEDEGYDIQAIKESEDIAYSMAYILDDEPNNLYVHTRILENNSYYTHYLLKYQLTDQELKDYKRLHKSGESSTDLYYQAFFLNDMISQMKVPQVLSESKIYKIQFDHLKEDLEGWSWEISNFYDFMFTNYNHEQGTFTMTIYPAPNSYSAIAPHKAMMVGYVKSNRLKHSEIYDGQSSFQHLQATSKAKELAAQFFFLQDNNSTRYKDYEVE